MTLQTILKDCQFVMDNSKYVTINIRYFTY